MDSKIPLNSSDSVSGMAPSVCSATYCRTSSKWQDTHAITLYTAELVFIDLMIRDKEEFSLPFVIKFEKPFVMLTQVLANNIGQVVLAIPLIFKGL